MSLYVETCKTNNQIVERRNVGFALLFIGCLYQWNQAEICHTPHTFHIYLFSQLYRVYEAEIGRELEMADTSTMAANQMICHELMIANALSKVYLAL